MKLLVGALVNGHIPTDLGFFVIFAVLVAIGTLVNGDKWVVFWGGVSAGYWICMFVSYLTGEYNG